jgi:hypothetical protein
MSMLSEIVRELSMKILNQHEIVNAPPPEVRELPGSLIWMLALLVNVAERRGSGQRRMDRRTERRLRRSARRAPARR